MRDKPVSQVSLSPLKIVPAEQGAAGSFSLADLKSAIAEWEKSQGPATASQSVSIAVQLPGMLSDIPTGWGDPKSPTGNP